jgi:thiol:disulfide interchange protein
MVINLLILFLLFAFVMLALSLFYKHEYEGGYWTVYIAGTFLTMLGIYIMINGIGNTFDWFTIAVGIVIVGLGIMPVITTGLEVLNLGNNPEAEED